MKCPLLMVATATSGLINRTDIDQCINEECAWWHKANEACSILTIAQGVVYLHKELLSLKGKPQRRPGK